jgi:Legionella pneumophila major outer membrane protein precursor
MRLILFLFSIFTFTLAYSFEEEDLITYQPYYVPQAKKYSQEKVLERSQIMSGYNAAAKIDLKKPIDAHASFSYLFLQPSQRGLMYAYTVEDSLNSSGKFFEMHSNYKSAFRVALGFSTNRDDWTYNLNYMRFHFSKRKNIDQRSINGWVNYNTATPDLMVMTKIKSKWNVNLDILDFLFERAFYSGTHLIIVPEFGLKGGWISQSFRTDSTRESDNAMMYSRDSLRSRLIGLAAGAKIQFLVFWGFNLYGNVFSSLFYQNFHVKNIQNSASDPSTLFDNSKNFISYINPSFQISSGLEWGSYFANKKAHVSFLVGYESQVYFNQNLLMELKELRANGYMQEAASLNFHGIVAKLKFNF